MTITFIEYRICGSMQIYGTRWLKLIMQIIIHYGDQIRL